MKMDFNCDIVRDLLPSYVDRLTSAATNAAVEAHLTECPACSEMLAHMSAPEAPEEPEQKELDFLKKQRRGKWLIALVCAVILAALAGGIWCWDTYYLGTALDPAQTLYYKDYDQKYPTLPLTYTVYEKNGRCYMEGAILNGQAFARITTDETDAGTVITVYTAPKTFFNSSSFCVSFACGDAPTILVGDLIAYQDHTTIQRATAQLIQDMDALDGDADAQALFDVLEEDLALSDTYNSDPDENSTHFLRLLSSSKSNWLLSGSLSMGTGMKRTYYEQQFRLQSCLLMALIPELKSVTWCFTNEDWAYTDSTGHAPASPYVRCSVDSDGLHHCIYTDPDTGEEAESISLTPCGEYITFTAQDASDFLDRDVKGIVTSAATLQHLLDELDCSPGRDLILGDAQRIDLYVAIPDNESIETATCQFTVNSVLVASETRYCTGNLSHFIFYVDDVDYTGSGASFEFPNGALSVRVGGSSGGSAAAPIDVSLLYGRSYYFTLTGDFDSGFTLTQN